MEAVLKDIKGKQEDVSMQSSDDSKSPQDKELLQSYPNVWSLKNSDDPRDQIRFGLFLQLLDKLIIDITDRLPEFQKKRPDEFSGRQKLYQFTMDQETESGTEWIQTNWKLINGNFYTRDFCRTKTRQRLVTNVVRHCTKWINKHYQFEIPIFYECKNVTSKDAELGKKITRKISYISF